jgi:Protein of unknown function (DUF2905)
MGLFATIFLVSLLVLGGITLWSERRGELHRPDDDGNRLTLLPGDMKYESPSGNFRFYFPITTSIVLSIVLTLVLRFFG